MHSLFSFRNLLLVSCPHRMLFRYSAAVDPLQVSMSCWMWSFNSSGSPSSVTKSKQHFSSCFRLSLLEIECWQRVLGESSLTPPTFPQQSLFVPPLPQQSPLFEHLDSPPWFLCSTFRSTMSSTISVTLGGASAGLPHVLHQSIFMRLQSL